MTERCFHVDLAESKRTAPSDMEAIRKLLPNCVRVVPATAAIDKAGGDFIAYMEDGSRVFIDCKGRLPGASEHWWKDSVPVPLKGFPQMAIEQWSQIPTEKRGGQIGWTLDAAKNTDYILQTFDASDCFRCWLLPAKALRDAFRAKQFIWEREFGPYRTSGTDGMYRTAYLYVPVVIVIAAVAGVSSCVYPGSAVNGAGGAR